MSKKPAKNTKSTADDRLSIEEQTAAFLKSGGSVEYVAKGTSGYVGPVGSKQAKPKSSS